MAVKEGIEGTADKEFGWWESERAATNCDSCIFTGAGSSPLAPPSD